MGNLGVNISEQGETWVTGCLSHPMMDTLRGFWEGLKTGGGGGRLMADIWKGV